MVLDPRKLAERSVPRYTSYPTAPHFTAAVGPSDYAAWLAALPPAATLSVYLHVPFCAELCLYCGCQTKIVHRRDPIEAYADRLGEEIALVSATTRARRVTHLHWGGGTPSMLGPDRLIAVKALIDRAFDTSAVAEHAIELDPRRMTEPLCEALAAIGVNRASLGVQDLSPQVQQAIGRDQPFDVVAEAVRMLRRHGIDHINVDLMYGLPRQTEMDVLASIALMHSLSPQRLALFGYAHVPWFKTHQRRIDEASLPDAAARLAQAEAARGKLLALGYQAIGLDHFAEAQDTLAVAARSGRLHRNFQGYSVDSADALIGLGASAIGRLPQGHVQNAPDIGGYSRPIAGGRLATVRGIAMSPDDRLRGRIIERLMCDFAVDLDAAVDNTGVAGTQGFAAELAALRPLADDGLVALDGRRIAVTSAGRPFVRLAAAIFDAHLARAQTRHSRAI
jgi:oxygen-independent coproporphyrinogen III oxidase